MSRFNTLEGCMVSRDRDKDNWKEETHHLSYVNLKMSSYLPFIMYSLFLRHGLFVGVVNIHMRGKVSWGWGEYKQCLLV